MLLVIAIKIIFQLVRRGGNRPTWRNRPFGLSVDDLGGVPLRDEKRKWNMKHETWNMKHENEKRKWNMKHETWNLKLETWKRKMKIKHEIWNMDETWRI